MSDRVRPTLLPLVAPATAAFGYQVRQPDRPADQRVPDAIVTRVAAVGEVGEIAAHGVRRECRAGVPTLDGAVMVTRRDHRLRGRGHVDRDLLAQLLADGLPARVGEIR